MVAVNVLPHCPGFIQVSKIKPLHFYHVFFFLTVLKLILNIFFPINLYVSHYDKASSQKDIVIIPLIKDW